MKTLIRLNLLLIVMLSSCSYDDSLLWEEIRDHEARIVELETLCNQMNTNISSLQTIVEVLQNNDYVTSVSPVMEDGMEIGYIITFSKSGAVTIYHGIDGKDGCTPIIGVEHEADNIYYWTLNGEFLIDDYGNKIKAVGTDGITPRLKIEDDKWYISYDNGLTYSLLGGAKGDKGDSFFSEVYKEGDFLIIKIIDGSTFKLPYYKGIAPKLITFKFLSKLNPLWLSSDIDCELKDNNIVECRIPNFVESKEFIPTFEFEGEKLLVDDIEVISGETKIDFRRPVKITILGESNQSIEYILNVRAFTGLPVVYIVTEGYTPVTSKDDYLNATFTLTEDIETRASGDSWTAEVKIKGRGNSTWQLDKKPYKIKFDEKVSVLGEAKAKSWLLLANHTDKTLIRNATAFYMGYKSILPYTTKYHYVELFLNDEYIGCYQLCEDKDIGKNRINLSNNGYLLEIDAKASTEDVTFKIATIAVPINIKEPEIEVGSEDYNLIKDYLTEVETVLYAENFTDQEDGYAKYLDIETFVDWYLINEISKNNDACYSSSYMTYEPGGKLCMGPLWDYDIAFGNCNYNGNNLPEGFWVKETGWYGRLFEDTEFVQMVKERFNYFYSLKEQIYQEINDNADYLKYSIMENDAKWNLLYHYSWPNHGIWGSYDNEIQYMKRWIDTRMDWLKTEFDKM